MSSVAERIVMFMVGADMLLEDRIDDLVQKHGQRIPGSTPEAKRQTLEHWASYDPSRNKKYFPWMFQQFIKGKTEWNDRTLDHVRDLLSDFEHYITMPSFEAPRDIYHYDMKSLEKTARKNAGLASKRDLKRGRERLDADVISSVGNIEVLAFKDGNTLAQEAWRAYSADNPNWTGAPLLPTMPKYATGYPDYPTPTTEPYSTDHLWCIRKPSRGADYIAKSPSKRFYVVRKNGGPYVGAEMGEWASQIVGIDNKQISMNVVEEIYDAFKPVLDEFAAKRWNVGSAASTLFGRLRIVRGELKPGETIQGTDLSNSSLKSLPDSLIVSGNLDVSGTKLKALPANLTVKGNLVISNTKISTLPPGLKVDGSLNLSGTKISSLPQGLKIGNLDISNTPVSQLPTGLQVTEVLKINGTPISVLPNDLRATKVYYSPETLTGEEIRRYFFWLRNEDLKKHFWKSPKVAGMDDPTKEVEWEKFVAPLMDFFQKAPLVGQAVAAMFEPVRTDKKRK